MADNATAVLPGTLQACFVVESERFAWWGTPDPAASADAVGLPTGATAPLPIARPDRDGRTAVPGTVPAVLIPAEVAVAALSGWRPGAAAVGASVHAWARIVAALGSAGDAADPAGLAGALPVAGHAALALDGDMIWSAEATVTALQRVLTQSAGTQPLALRPYQRAGVLWLEAAAAHGGGVLADEMGLGKTVQAIAVLAASHAGPHLVVCPTSLVGNWARELARFAPGLHVRTHTGAGRERGLDDVAAGSVLLTTYPMLRLDAAHLTGRAWDVAVLDEAQQIKNPDTQAARTARTLTARLRIAMTGTPVENSLDELWSLLAFTTPGLLGSRARFRRRFARTGPSQPSPAAARLSALVSPHLLRRRKSDVAPELPDKIESTVICPLSTEQERLYRAQLDVSFGAGLGRGVQRHGRVLALLTKLKHICNHPELHTATGAALAGRSGKLDRLTDILGEVVDAHDAALVFTQYRRTGELLARHLAAQITGAPVPFLHGGLTAPAREQLLAEFQDDSNGPPILILSLRAAGFGLNLTRATEVIHFDRWWNPAVEDQASDRAHRIGQTRAVTIHTLQTERTLEEAIAEMHAGKRAIAGLAEGWSVRPERQLVRLSDQSLHDLLDPRPTR